MWNIDARSRVMMILSPALLIALAALVSSLSALIWSIRRKP